MPANSLDLQNSTQNRDRNMILQIADAVHVVIAQMASSVQS